MAIFSKKAGDEGPAAVPEAVVAAGAKPGAQAEGSRLIVGPNIRLTGSEIADCDTVIVEGRVEATVNGRVMQISETGMFTGTAQVEMAEIRGHFQGDITVTKRLTVCGTGKVAGKIRYGSLVVEEGGELSGDIESLAPAPVPPAKTSGKSAPTLAPVEPASKAHH